jgi:quaternary ammonium compound-resistance protein SugE
MYSLKFIDKNRLSSIQWHEVFHSLEPWKALLPVLGYVLFGVGNVVFFSIAMKKIPVPIAFAIWMGLALVGSIIIDALWFKQHLNWLQILFVAFIGFGIVGLKIFSKLN